MSGSEDEAGRLGKVSVIVIATGRYHEFLPELLLDMKRHIIGLEQVFVLSDVAPARDEVLTWLPWGHSPWPYSTLLRYRAMHGYRSVLGSVDLLLYMDVDMRIRRDIALPSVNGILAVEHPGYAGMTAKLLPYERRTVSRAAVRDAEGLKYFCGGVQGGGGAAYLDAVAAMAGWIQEDLENGVMPVWHDESVWNRFCIDSPPDVVLPRSYCSPEHERDPEAYIVALDKNHGRLRGVPRSSRLKAAVVRSVGSPLGRFRNSLRHLGRPS